MKNEQIKNLVIISIALSCLAVFWVGFMTFGHTVNADSTSFVLGAFTLLVTLLVAWNIWSTIDVKSNKKEQDSRFIDIQRKFNHTQNEASYNMALMYGRTSQMISCSLANIGKEELKKDMLRSAITSVKMFANLSSEKEYNSILRTTLEAMAATEKIYLSEGDIDKLLLMIGEIQQRESIPLLNDLVLAIRKCKKQSNG